MKRSEIPNIIRAQKLEPSVSACPKILLQCCLSLNYAKGSSYINLCNFFCCEHQQLSLKLH